MEVVQQILAESVSGGFWKFVGYWVLIALPFKLVGSIVKAIFNHLTIRKNGYPPEHCNASGDFLTKDK